MTELPDDCSVPAEDQLIHPLEQAFHVRKVMLNKIVPTRINQSYQTQVETIRLNKNAKTTCC